MNPFDQIGSPTAFIFIVVVLGISFILLMRTSRYFSRQRREESKWPRAARPGWDGSSTAIPTTPPTSSPTTPPTASQRHLDAMPSTAQWEVDMHETARELKAQLDSKMRALQALIAEADRAASRLEATLKTRHNKDDTPSSNRPRSGGSPLFNPKPGPPSVQEKNPAGLPANQAQTLRPASPPTASAVSSPHRHEEIYTLSDYGLSDSAIAQRLAMPVGEVELILSLRGKARS
ncbi:MAG: hypothetical protein ABSA16_08315 [Thermoguttaceae bacterium]